MHFKVTIRTQVTKVIYVQNQPSAADALETAAELIADGVPYIAIEERGNDFTSTAEEVTNVPDLCL